MDVLGGFEGRKILEPEASGLAGIVAELIRLDYLVGFADAGADTAGRVFQRDPVDRGIEEELDESEGFFSLGRAPRAPIVPVEAGGAEVGARRVGDEQIPRVVKDVADIALVVIARGGGWQEVAGPCFVSRGGEGIADGAGELTGHKHSHG